MSESLTAARPYAKALYEVVSGDNPQDWLPLMQILKALGENDDTRRLLNSHDLTQDNFNKITASLFASAKIDKVPAKFQDFINVLSHNKRFALVPEIATLFIEEVNKSQDQVIAKITSAKPLDDESKANLVAKLEAKFGKKVETSIDIDESLIGGAVIKVGDTVIDGSVRGRLEQLTKALN